MPIYVFQYGSNCSAERLNSPKRLAGSARDLGLATTVEPHTLSFDVWSRTNDCAAADLIPVQQDGDVAYGVLYEVPEDRVRGAAPGGHRTLTQIEGPRYREQAIRVRKAEGGVVDAVTFTVVETHKRSDIATNADYVRWIVDGLRAHGAPSHYIETVKSTAIATIDRILPDARAKIAEIENL